MNYQEAMNHLALKQILQWHEEQVSELEGEQDQESVLAFHQGAVNVLKEFVK